MGLNTTNTDAISFKKLSGKAHTQQNFALAEESIQTNVQISYSTVFSNPIEPLPATNSGLTSPYDTNGIVQLVKFELDLIPDTQIAAGRSQGYRLKLPSDWNANGALYPKFVAGEYLYTSLGKLQIVPALYGTVKIDGSTEYDPILYTTTNVVIPKFDTINWYYDPYNSVLFVQDPPAGFDVSSSRPGFLQAYLYVGDYLDDIIFNISSGNTGTTGINVGGGVGVFKDKIVSTGGTSVLRFKSFVGFNGISITADTDNVIVSYTGATGSSVTASNGLNKVGNDIRLGGTITGETKIEWYSGCSYLNLDPTSGVGALDLYFEEQTNFGYTEVYVAEDTVYMDTYNGLTGAESTIFLNNNGFIDICSSDSTSICSGVIDIIASSGVSICNYNGEGGIKIINTGGNTGSTNMSMEFDNYAGGGIKIGNCGSDPSAHVRIANSGGGDVCMIAFGGCMKVIGNGAPINLTGNGGDITLTANGCNIAMNANAGIQMCSNGILDLFSNSNVEIESNSLFSICTNGGISGYTNNGICLFNDTPTTGIFIKDKSTGGTQIITSKLEINSGTTYTFSLDLVNQRLAVGNSVQVTGGSVNYTFGDGNINAGTFGSVIFGEASEIGLNHGSAMAVGENVFINAYGGKAFGRGARVNANANYSFIGGIWLPGGTNPKTNHKVPQVGGQGAFAWYNTNGGQTDNHGALADGSVILGGTNHHIAAGNSSAVILGGSGIKLTGTTYVDTTAVAKFAIMSTPAAGTSGMSYLVRDSATGIIKTMAGSGGGSPQNVYVAKVVITGSTTLNSSNFVVFANHSAAITITLPASPVDGQVYKIKDVSGNAGTNTITVSGNGNNVDGSPSVLINTSGGGVELCFEASLNSWFVMNFVG